MKSKKKKKIGAKKVWRLIRYLEHGDRLTIRGVRGKRIKSVRAGRAYVLEVRNGGKLKGYINNTDPNGKPIAKPYTSSMLNRLKHTTREKLTGQRRQSSHSFKITNKKRVQKQIPDQVVDEILGRRKCTYGFRIEFQRGRLLTPFVYTNGKLKESDLRDNITSNILLTLNSNRFRISPVLEGHTDPRSVTRLKEAQVTLEFMELGEMSNEPASAPDTVAPAETTAKRKARKRPAKTGKKLALKKRTPKKPPGKKATPKKPVKKTKSSPAPKKPVRKKAAPKKPAKKAKRGTPARPGARGARRRR